MNTPIKDLFALADEAVAPVIWTEKKALQKFKEAATPEQLREVAKAFRSLEQRAEAAEAKLAELVPPGWMVLPIEPTKEMKLASRRYVAKTKLTSGPGFYRAMVAAAPTLHE